jgi:uncharacterized protein (TIGR03086 family)
VSGIDVILVPMTTNTAQIPDLRPTLLHAFDVADGLVSALQPAEMGLPTPCPEFDVLGLLDHLVMVARRVRVVLTGGHFAEVPQVSGVTAEDAVAAWASSLAALREALPAVELDALVTAPFGTVPGAAAVASYVAEVAVHSWDLAVATGRTGLLDPALAEPVLGAARQRIPREGREHIPFGDVVDVTPDASAYDQLVAWMGRDPRWRA